MKFLLKLFYFTAIIFIFTCSDDNKPYEFNNIDWTRFRGNEGNGISIEKGWNPKSIGKKMKILWEKNIGSGYSSVSIKGDYLYSQGYNNSNVEETLQCMNVKDGKILWQYSIPSKRLQYAGSRSTPTIDGNYIYTSSCDGKILCMDSLTGKLIWQKDLIKEFNSMLPAYGFAGSCVIDGDLLIINANLHGIALNKNTGEAVWISRTWDCGYSTPVIINHNNQKYALIFGFRKLFVVNINNGKLFSSYDWITFNNVNASDPIIKDDKIFISSGYGKGASVLQIKKNNLEKIWENNNLCNHFSSCILIDDNIYGINGNSGGLKQIRCIDFNTGEIKWTQKENFGSLLYSDNKLIFLSETGEIKIFDISGNKCRELSSGKLKINIYWTMPVLCRGMLFIRNQKGDLYCIDIK